MFLYIVSLVRRLDILPPTETELLSCDPRLYRSGAVLQIDKSTCPFEIQIHMSLIEVFVIRMNINCIGYQKCAQ